MDAGDVNDYLQEITGRDVTAKDFRTWAGTMLAARELRTYGPAKNDKEARKNIVRAIDATAGKLGNTRTVCRKYYIHPALIEAYLEGSVLPPLLPHEWKNRQRHSRAMLRSEEEEVLAFLRERLNRKD